MASPLADLSWDAFTLKGSGAKPGDAVATWPNRGSTGTAHNAQAGAGSGTATYQETQAGLPYVNFAGSYFALRGPGIAWRFSGAADAGVTAVVVVKVPQQAGYAERLLELSHPDCTYAINLYRHQAESSLLFATLDASFTDYSAAVIVSNAFSSSSSFQIFTGVAAPSETRMYRDGELVGSTTGFTPHKDRTTTLNYLGLSCWGLGSVVPPLTADVHEISIWRRVLSDTELAQLHAQLASKWKLSATPAPATPGEWPEVRCNLRDLMMSCPLGKCPGFQSADAGEHQT